MRTIYPEYRTRILNPNASHSSELENGSVPGISPDRRKHLMQMFEGNPKLKSIMQKASAHKKLKAKTLKAKNHFFAFMNLVTSIKNKKMSKQQMEKAQRLYRERNTIMPNNPFSQLYTEPFEITKKLHNVDVLADKYQEYAFLNNERSMNAKLKEYKLLLNTVNILNRQRTVEELRALKGGVKREMLQELQQLRQNTFARLTNRDFEIAQNLQRKYKRIYERLQGMNNKNEYKTVSPQEIQAMINNARNPTLSFPVNKLALPEAIALGRKVSKKLKKRVSKRKEIDVNPSPRTRGIPGRKLKLNRSRLRPTSNPLNIDQDNVKNTSSVGKTQNDKKARRKPWMTVPKLTKGLVGAIGALYGSMYKPNKPFKTNSGNQPALPPYADQLAVPLPLPPAPTRLALPPGPTRLALPPGPTRLALTRKTRPNYYVDSQYLYRNPKPKGTKTPFIFAQETF